MSVGQVLSRVQPLMSCCRGSTDSRCSVSFKRRGYAGHFAQRHSCHGSHSLFGGTLRAAARFALKVGEVRVLLESCGCSAMAGRKAWLTYDVLEHVAVF